MGHIQRFQKRKSKVILLSRPKANFRLRLSDDEFLSVSIFPTKRDPTAEVISIQVSRPPKGDELNWETIGRIAIYRSPEGNYSELPDRGKTT
jgi:hypothetical protein